VLDKFFDTLANMGIWIRLNDKRTEPPSEQGRAWGRETGGFALSIARKGEGLSVLIKNTTDSEKRATVSQWLHYLKVEIDAPLSPYGKQLLQNEPHGATRVFPANAYLATEIPVAALYTLKPSVPYRITVTCPVPGHPEATVTSNELQFTIPG
jgi:hypothetical protein